MDEISHEEKLRLLGNIVRAGIKRFKLEYQPDDETLKEMLRVVFARVIDSPLT